jgi:hypothetical protein
MLQCISLGQAFPVLKKRRLPDSLRVKQMFAFVACFGRIDLRIEPLHRTLPVFSRTRDQGYDLGADDVNVVDGRAEGRTQR